MGVVVRRRSYLWFIVAGVCVVLTVLIFAGRTLLSEWLGDSLTYRVVIAAAWVFLAGAAGALTRAFTSPDTEPTAPAPPRTGP